MHPLYKPHFSIEQFFRPARYAFSVFVILTVYRFPATGLVDWKQSLHLAISREAQDCLNGALCSALGFPDISQVFHLELPQESTILIEPASKDLITEPLQV